MARLGAWPGASVFVAVSSCRRRGPGDYGLAGRPLSAEGAKAVWPRPRCRRFPGASRPTLPAGAASFDH